MTNTNELKQEFQEKPQEKHYIEEGFQEDWSYKAQKSDWTETLFSIIPELIGRKAFENIWNNPLLRSIFLSKINEDNFYPKIKWWDIININQGDGISFDLTIWKESFTINIYNRTIIKHSSYIEEEEKK